MYTAFVLFFINFILLVLDEEEVSDAVTDHAVTVEVVKMKGKQMCLYYDSLQEFHFSSSGNDP